MMSPPPPNIPSVFNPLTFSQEKGTFTVNAIVYELGSDCLVILWGGTRLHVGAVGIAQARPSLKNPLKISSTSSVFTYPGHKEDVVAKTMSEEISRRLGRNTVVAAGLHWDCLSESDISMITKSCLELTDRIVSRLSGSTDNG